jgi:hypothetical protein
MSDAKHSPTLWRAATPHGGYSEIRDRDNKLVFGVAAGSPNERQSPEVCQANLDHIVKCVNERDALVSALHDLVSCHYYGGDVPPDSIMGEALDALKRAGVDVRDSADEQAATESQEG